MKAPIYSALEGSYAALWSTMTIKPQWKSAVYRKAKQIVANKDKYQEISKIVNVPWYFIGVIHSLECNLDFTKHLHNGDSLQKKTRRVPAGRPLKGNGPFTFTESAVDALKMKGFDKVTDWSPEHMAFMLEKYNGWGYYYKKRTSPYLWSGSNHYTKGKYVADHKYDASAVSEQIGTMPLLKAVFDVADEEKVLTYKEAVKSRPQIRFTERLNGFFTWLGLPAMFSLTTLQDVKEFATDNAAFLILGLSGAAYIAVKYIQYLNKDTVKQGRVKKGRVT